MKALIHVDREDQVAMSIALSNAENLLEAVPGAEVAVVANGDAVLFFAKQAPAGLRDRLSALAARGRQVLRL